MVDSVSLPNSVAFIPVPASAVTTGVDKTTVSNSGSPVSVPSALDSNTLSMNVLPQDLSSSGTTAGGVALDAGVTVAFSKERSKSSGTLKVQKPTFPEGGFKVADIQETFNHLNGTNDSKGIALEVLGQHPHHANLAKAFEAYAEDTRFNAAKRADAAKFAQTENKRGNELKFLANVAFIAQQDGNAKKLTLAEVKGLDLNKDGNITQDEVGTLRARFPAVKIPDIEKKKEAKPNLQPGEVDLKALQATLNQVDNKTRAGEVTQEMLQKAVETSGKKLGILNEIMKDPALRRRFGGEHNVPEAIEREKGTVKNGTFLLKKFNQISSLDVPNAFNGIKANPALATGLENILKKSTTISTDDLKRIAATAQSKTVISPNDFRKSAQMNPADLVNILMVLVTMLLQMQPSAKK